jgi:hypothetical protein
MANLHVVGLQLAHELKGLAHAFDFGLDVGLHFVFLVLEFLFLQLHLDGRTFEDQVIKVDFLPRDTLPVVEE